MLPLYYKETFFTKDSLLHPEVGSEAMGVAGDPVPYQVRNDDVITSLLLICLVAMVLTLANYKKLIGQWFKVLLSVQTCLLTSIIGYFAAKEYMAETFVINSEYLLIFIFFAILIAYFGVKVVLYDIVNGVFFDGKRNGQLIAALLTAAAAQGVALLPVVLLLVYFGLSLQNVLYYFAIIVVIAKIWAFYKSYVIFFRQKGFFLQIILYFCALEAVPLAALVGAWQMTVGFLEVNY
jgi:hypothetical protein